MKQSIASIDDDGILQETTLTCEKDSGYDGLYLYAYDPNGGWRTKGAAKVPYADGDAALSPLDREGLLIFNLADSIQHGGTITPVSGATLTVSDASPDYPLPAPGYTVTLADGKVASITLPAPAPMEGGTDRQYTCSTSSTMTYGPDKAAFGIVKQWNEIQDKVLPK